MRFTILVLQRRGERLSGKQNDSSPQSLKDISHRFQFFFCHFLQSFYFYTLHYSRTKSDITQSGSKVGRSFTLSRSKSIASARDRWKLSSSYGLLPFLGKEKQEKEKEEERELVLARQESEEEQREMMSAETRQSLFHFAKILLPFFFHQA